MSSKFYSISCTNCAAPLTIRGGGRINSVTCEYCNSVLDMNNEYKVLSKFKSVDRPNIPFKLGMQGKIMDIEWSIIACVSYRTKYPEDAPWSELSLYSPLYGYAWLVYEEGNISFSKRVRDFDIYSWIKEREPSTAFYKATHYYIEDEAYNSYIDFVEGELSYIAKKNDKTKCWDYKGVNGKSITIEKIKDEIEIYHTQKLKAKEVYDSFGIKEKSYKDFPKEERVIEPIKFAKHTLISLGVIFFMLFLSMFTSSTIYTNDKLSKDINGSFIITSNAFVDKIDISTSSYSYNLKDLSIIIKKSGADEYDTPIFYMDINRTFFANDDYNQTYYSYDNHIEIYINLDEGNYTIELKNSQVVSVTIEQRYIHLSHIIIMLVLYILFGILNTIVHISQSTNILYGFIFFILGSYFFSFGLTIVALIGYIVYYNYTRGVVK
ncbi:MAG: DUF4178 domain-containing protein [Sulfurovum sp.]